MFALDNACFAGQFKPMEFFALVRQTYGALRWQSFCLFASAPDVVGDPVATYRRGYTMLHHIRNWGVPAGYVAQDGMESQGLVKSAIFWDEFDALFLGGSTEWKLGPGAAWLAGEARARRKWVHMGRVNSLQRLQYAATIGCQSADGTYLRFGPDKNLPKLLSWVRAVNTTPGQQLLFAA